MPNMARRDTKTPAPSEIVARAPIRGVVLPSDDTSEHIARNRAAWERWALDARPSARESWRNDELLWGVWNTPESELQLVGELQPGADVIELGCGTAAISAWLARRNVRPVAVDFSRTATRDRRTAPGRVRTPLSPGSRRRREYPVRRGQLRSRHLGVRRKCLVRSPSLAATKPIVFFAPVGRSSSSRAARC